MVPLSEREIIVRRALDDSELRPFLAFIFGEKPDIPASVHTPDLVLLSAISRKDPTAFGEQVNELAKRRISPEATWCDNDCLIFCLLLGCEMFQVDSPVVQSILDAREQNRNPVPRRVNEVFRSLSRKEYALAEEFAFIKLVFNQLRNKFGLDTDEAVKLYKNLIKPNFCEELSPFLSLLAVRAYDLILVERKPSILETFPQVIEGIEKLSGKLSVRQLSQLFMALPVRSLLVIGGVAVTIFCAGVTTGKFASALAWPATRPDRLKVTSVQDGGRSDDRVVGSIITTLLSSHHARAGAPLRVLLVEADPPGSTTSKYSTELSIQDVPILDGCAFSVKDSDTGVLRLILPVRISSGTLKVFVPASDGSARIQFLLLVDIPGSVDLSVLSNGLIIRVLD